MWEETPGPLRRPCATARSLRAAPKDYLQSTDLALRLVLRLRDDGELTVSGAAKLLGGSSAAVHRAFQMLVYRGFAVRSERRTYLPGPALSTSHLRPGRGSKLTDLARETMAAIAAETRETCHLTVLSGTHSHFLHSEEGTQIVRVGNRTGQVIPADENAGGLICLADLSASELRSRYPDMRDTAYRSLRRRLHRFRSPRFAVNNALYAREVSGVAAALHNNLGDTLGALSVTTPTTRFRAACADCVRVLLRRTDELNRHIEDIHAAAGDFEADALGHR